MAIKIGGTTIVTDGRGVTNITSGVIVGVKSDGTYLGAGATTLNFVGSAVSIRAVDAGRVDVIVSGGGGAGVSSTGILTCRGIANADDITESVTLDDFYGAGTNYAMVGPITVVGGGTTVTVGSGVSYVIV
jgi:hypothetical protein